MSIRVGVILRHEDESGISGTGVVAEWVEYSDGEVVVHWTSHTPSTNHYRNFKQVEAIHGHGGKTELVTIWEQPKPQVELSEVDPALVEESAQEAGEAQPNANTDKVEPEGKKNTLEEEEPPKKTAPRKKTTVKKKEND